MIKLERKSFSFGKIEESEQEDRKYWAQAGVEEKLAMINHLRECFYGPQATTGRLQRFFEFTKQAQR